MALLRFVKRRLSFFGLVLIATIFWIFYLIMSAPAASDSTYHNGVLPHSSGSVNKKESVTRKLIVPTVPNAIPGIFERRKEQPLNPPSESDIHGDEVEVPDKQVIPRPPPEVNQDTLQDIKPFADNVNKVVGVNTKQVVNGEGVGIQPVEKTGNSQNADNVENPVDDKKVSGEEKSGDKNSTELIMKIPTKPANATEKKINDTEPPVLKKMENKVIEMGASIKNKTMGDWEKVKNKTIEKLQDFGVIKKHEYVKLIYTPVKWPLNISFEAIGNVMKDTQYLKVQQNLTEMEYHPLVSNGSSQLNVSTARYGLGYCDCKDLECMCCVRVYNKWMLLNSTACSFITYSSKAQELTFEYSIDKAKIFERKIAAEFPPKICLESTSKAAGLCTLFSNVTAKVNIASENHKIHLSGCMEFDLTLYNRTVNSFPVGCFQIPGKSSKDSEENQAKNLINFMP